MVISTQNHHHFQTIYVFRRHYQIMKDIPDSSSTYSTDITSFGYNY